MRREAGLSQEELGARAGTSGALISLLESGKRGASPAIGARIAQALALGRPNESEAGPLFLLASTSDGDARFLADEHGRFGVFCSGTMAITVAGILAPYGVPHPCALACWTDAIARLAAEVRPQPGYEHDRLVVLDREGDERELGIRVGEHFTSILRGLIAAGNQVEAEALVASR